MLVEVTEFLVKSLVTEPDLISVKEYDDEELITLEILVSIGKEGKIASALRTIIRAISYKNTNKKITINIDSF